MRPDGDRTKLREWRHPNGRRPGCTRSHGLVTTPRLPRAEKHAGPDAAPGTEPGRRRLPDSVRGTEHGLNKVVDVGEGVGDVPRRREWPPSRRRGASRRTTADRSAAVSSSSFSCSSSSWSGVDGRTRDERDGQPSGVDLATQAMAPMVKVTTTVPIIADARRRRKPTTLVTARIGMTAT